MLELINVKKLYQTKAGDTAALNGISIIFPKTGLVFITGKSGSGKTTMLNVIGGLDGIDEGEIVIEGKKFSEFSSADYDSYRNTFVGFIFQEYNLLPEYSVAKNIGMANELQGRPINEEEINNLLEAVDMQGYGLRKTSELSGGQKQRVAIARALIKNPQIIMADEPTGALDSATGIQVMETLKKLSKEKLIIVVSHDLELAEKYADRIVTLVDGQIINDESLTEVEFTGSFYESNNEVVVKSGGDLTSEETGSLVNAIKEKKKISVTDKISIRERGKTKPIEREEVKHPVKLINSKMKLKSAVELGLKSLFVKPFRLAITILLSVISFAVFGLFDSVASFTGERVVADILRTENYSSISVYSTINNDNYSGETLKISKEYIDKLNETTGYNFRGVYDINDVENVNDMNRRVNVNRSLLVSKINERTIYAPKGEGLNYYNMYITGYVEFKSSEIDENGVIDGGGFNFKIVDYENSAYPVYDASNPDAPIQIGISSFTADAICYWHNKMTSFEKISPQDLIGKELYVSGFANRPHIVTAIIDCGEVPQKYNELKTVISTDDTIMLEQDLITFLNSSCYLNFFVADGFVDGLIKKNNRIVTYVDQYLSANYTAEESGKVSDKTPNDTSFRYYNENELTSQNVLLFDMKAEDAPTKPALKEDETLIHVNNLLFLFKNEFAANYEETMFSEALLTARRAAYQMGKASNYQEMRKEFNTFIENLNFLFTYLNRKMPGRFDVDGDGLRDDKTITIKTEINGILDESKTKVLKVKGVYFGVNTDFGVALNADAILGALVLSEDGLKSLGITLEQGHYSRLIAPSMKDRNSTNALAKYMANETGIKLNWYKNNVLSVLDEAKVAVKQFSNLFLYVSLALAFFAIFMLFNYISTSIVSKRQSIGVLRALGADGKNIFEMFITESLIISLINGVFACIVAYFACGFVNTYVVEIMNITINFALYGIRQVLVIMIASILTGIVSSLIPIIKISKEKPVDLIRKV